MVRLLRLLPEDHLHKEFLGDGRVQGTRLTRSARTENDHQEERSVLLEAIMRLRRGIEAISVRPLSRLRRWGHRHQYSTDTLRQDWIRHHILRQGWIRQRGPLWVKNGLLQGHQH